MRATVLTSWIGVANGHWYADAALSCPPARAHIQRVDGDGQRVAKFVVPLELCLTSNVRMQSGKASQGRILGKLKKDCYMFMLAQHGRIERKPLAGRPLVRCIRFSSSEPDRTSDWSKNPVDRLCAVKNGLGIIRDDAPRFARIECWWEPAPAGRGFVFLDVWTGKETNCGYVV